MGRPAARWPHFGVFAPILGGSKWVTVAVLVFMAVSSLITTGAFGSKVDQFSVDPAHTIVWTANLGQSDQFSGSMSISGGSGNDINFWVTDPAGSVVVNQGRVSQGTSFAFTASMSGGYTLHFDNSFSLFSGKLVTLTYDITLSVVTNLTVVVLGMIVGGLAVGLFVFMKVKKKKGPAATTTTTAPATK